MISFHVFPFFSFRFSSAPSNRSFFFSLLLLIYIHRRTITSTYDANRVHTSPTLAFFPFLFIRNWDDYKWSYSLLRT